MMEIADLISRALAGRDNEAELKKVREEVRNLTRRYPLPG
jgi:glycine/serine hydroxymethyltransferase